MKAILRRAWQARIRNKQCPITSEHAMHTWKYVEEDVTYQCYGKLYEGF